MERRRTLRTTGRASTVALEPDRAWSVIASGHDGPQWYVDAAPFVFRGALDRLVGGPGRRHRPPGRALLVAGDRVGFWRVVAADHPRRTLVLEALVRVPGRVRLEVSAAPDLAGTRVDLTVGFAPRGIVGRAYLVVDLPARAALTGLVMLHLLTVLRRHADHPPS